MANLEITRNVNPALLTEILDHEGFVAFWYRDGSVNRIVTDAPMALVLASACHAGGR